MTLQEQQLRPVSLQGQILEGEGQMFDSEDRLGGFLFLYSRPQGLQGYGGEGGGG